MSDWSRLLGDSVYLVQRMREGSFYMSFSCCSVEVRLASGSFILAGKNSSRGLNLLHVSSSDSSVPDVSIEYLIVVSRGLKPGFISMTDISNSSPSRISESCLFKVVKEVVLRNTLTPISEP